MGKKYGRCSNYGECDLANNYETIESSDENFVCTDCGKPLIIAKAPTNSISINNKQKWIKPLLWGLPVLGIISLIALSSVNSSDTSTTETQIENNTDNVSNIKSDSKPILRLHGSNNMAEGLIGELAKVFLEDKGYTNIKKISTEKNEWIIQGTNSENKVEHIEIKAHGSHSAFEAIQNDKEIGLMEGYADIGLSYGKIEDEVANRMKIAGLGDLNSPIQEKIIALDAIAIVVNPNNPLNELTMEQLHDVFVGKITNWSQINPENSGKINLYSLPKEEGLHAYLQKELFNKSEDIDYTKSKIIASSKEMASHVASDKNAIGFLSLHHKGTSKTLGIQTNNNKAIYPTDFSIKTEDYPFADRMYFYTDNHPSAIAMEFINFVLSHTGQQLIETLGFLSTSKTQTQSLIKEENEEKNAIKADILNNPTIPLNYKELIRKAEREALDFRFNPNEIMLDTLAIQEINTLIEDLKNTKGKIILIGFSDPIGEEQKNFKLSMDRADAVKQHLIEHGITNEIVTQGFGEEPSLLLDNHPTNPVRLEKNRRVEVWLER